MKKTIFTITLFWTLSSCCQEGLIIQFMREQDEALKLPSASDVTSTAAIAVGATVAGVAASSSTQPQPQTRSLVSSPTIPIISSPYLWFTLGGLAVAFSVYHFIGHEMAIIIETKGTLLALEKQIQLWEKELPLLKENQENLDVKVKQAIGVLDTITPLVVKLAKHSDTQGTTAQVNAIKKELTDLKDLVNTLAAAQGTNVSQAISKKSFSLFKLGKKERGGLLTRLLSKPLWRLR